MHFICCRTYLSLKVAVVTASGITVEVTATIPILITPVVLVVSAAKVTPL